MSGYLKIDRKIRGWKYITEPLAFALWIHLLMMAGWEDSGDFKKGELVTSISSLTELTGISRPRVRKWLRAFQEDGQIQIEKNGKHIRIILLNYERYNWQKKTTSEEENDPNWQKKTSKVEKKDQITGKKRPDNWQKKTTSEESHPYISKTLKNNKRSKNSLSKERESERESQPSIPTIEEVRDYCQQNDLIVDPEEFWLFYDSKGWKVGKDSMHSWKSTLRSWNLRRKKQQAEKDPEEQYKEERKKRGGLPFA